MLDIENEGKYIYCIIASEFSREFDISGIGERGDTVYSICTNGIAAVVSNAPLKKYKTSRENLMTHEKVIEEVIKQLKKIIMQLSVSCLIYVLIK